MRLPFSVVTKPTGAACNLDCEYCFFLSKELLYPGDGQRMSRETLRAYLASFLDTQPDGDVTVVWQGGEPTMRGLDFFADAVALGRELARPTQRVAHALQTNGVLLDDAWGEFLAANGFLVGLSVDGPADLHDRYRVNMAGRDSHDQVERAWRLLQRHGVDVNILCTVTAANQAHASRVYRYFRDDLGARFLQFIPVVERGDDGSVAPYSVDPAAFGGFMSSIWDEWVARDVGEVFVQHFDVALGNRFGQHTMCVHSPECGAALAVMHNGDVYACDHYVEPGHLLGNVATDRFDRLLLSDSQREFGRSKRTGLTAQCLRCPVRWACHGGCPKDRFAVSVDGEPGQNWLCPGYEAFFRHIAPGIETMASLIAGGRPASDIMA